MRFWWDVDRAVKKAVKDRESSVVKGIHFVYQSGMLFIKLSSGRRLAYVKPKDVSLDAICEQMGRTPPWAKGLILRADGYETEFYKKDYEIYGSRPLVLTSPGSSSSPAEEVNGPDAPILGIEDISRTVGICLIAAGAVIMAAAALLVCIGKKHKK